MKDEAGQCDNPLITFTENPHGKLPESVAFGRMSIRLTFESTRIPLPPLLNIRL